MEDPEHPQQIVTQIDNLVFFSNFDSGNLSRVQKVSMNTVTFTQYELSICPDAAACNFNSYKSWFFFGIRGLKKGSYIRLSITGLPFSRPFNSPTYRPVYRCLPAYGEWQRIPTESVFEPTYSSSYKYTFTFEALSSDGEHFFAYSTPYPYTEIIRNLSIFEKMCPLDSLFYKETLTKSIDGRDVPIITISSKSNFSQEKEEKLPAIFPTSTPRVLKSLKPIIFISARVHPGETPASFLLDGLFLSILANDAYGQALRSNFVFKIIPVLNPDGVYRGHFRVDQNGVNLNRCYLSPSISEHPSIYAARNYFLYLQGVKYYFDLHAHNSKRSCFLFGNYLGLDRQPENQIYAKLIEMNTSFFDFTECDFSEKSMTAKDPKDHHSKEGSGRVALFNATGVIYSYTVECSYYMSRPLHAVSQANPRRKVENFNLISVYNRAFFNDFACGMMTALLDLEKKNPNSRLIHSEYRDLESLMDYLRVRNHIQSRIIGKNLLKPGVKEVKALEKPAFPRLQMRKIHKLNVVVPVFGSLAQKPKTVIGTRGKSLIRE